eukprot:Amastigsp_a174919_9.p4 type:complete len:142 gc:universal Amastigsp_a174919_9:694-269(-)
MRAAGSTVTSSASDSSHEATEMTSSESSTLERSLSFSESKGFGSSMSLSLSLSSRATRAALRVLTPAAGASSSDAASLDRASSVVNSSPRNWVTEYVTPLTCSTWSPVTGPRTTTRPSTGEVRSTSAMGRSPGLSARVKNS